jgi:hypothetical protein
MQIRISLYIKLLLVVFMATALMARADEYSLSYGIGVRTNYDDNINGGVVDKKSGTAQVISPTFNTAWTTETSSTDIKLNLDFYRYNRPGYDTDNQRISFNNRWSYNESQMLSFDARLTRDSTSTSEAQVLDTGVTVQERVSERRIEKNFSPSWSWLFTELDSFNLAYNYFEIDYGSLENSGYINTDGYSITPSYSRALREDWSVFAQYDYSVSKTADRDLYSTFQRIHYARYSTETTTKGVAIGSNFQITENWLLNGYIGRNTSDGKYKVSTFNYIDEACEVFVLRECDVLKSLEDYSNNGSYANISLKWSNEILNAAIAYNSNVSPSSNGYSQQSDRWSITSGYALSEKQRINLSYAYIENFAIDENTQNLPGFIRDREITTMQVAWNYQIFEEWSLAISYGYDETEYLGSGTIKPYSVDSVSFSAGISWRPQKISWAN